MFSVNKDPCVAANKIMLLLHTKFWKCRVNVNATCWLYNQLYSHVYWKFPAT